MLLLHSNTWYYRYIFHWFTVWVSCLDNTKPPLYFSHFSSLIRHWRTCYLKLGTCSGPLMWLSPRWCHTDLQQRSHKSTRELQNEAIQKEPLGCSFCEQGTLPFFYFIIYCHFRENLRYQLGLICFGGIGLYHTYKGMISIFNVLLLDR